MPASKVSFDRWRQAQEWELALWQRAQVKRGWRKLVWPLARPLLERLGSSRVTGDDWNRWWAAHFDGYDFLPPHLGRYIELGSGPYTNTRLILEGRSADVVVCSDPLIREYVEFRGRWLAEAHAAGLVTIDDHPIEDLPFANERFDVVAMINVLDHVRDAELCLQRATGLVRDGGHLILGQDLSNEEDVRRAPDDIGHPIRLRREDMDPQSNRSMSSSERTSAGMRDALPSCITRR